MKVPGVQIDRESFLRGALLRQGVAGDQVEESLDATPLSVGISRETVDGAVSDAISYESRQTTVISAAAGLPGGLALLGTVPADMAQYFAHIIRVAQKVAYLYGWDSFVDESGAFSEEAKEVLVLFFGVMSGVQAAVMAINEIVQQAEKTVAKRIAAQALTKTMVYPVVKKVCQILGVQMTKQIFGRSVAKVVPVLGGAVSGGLTYVTFKPMCKKLRNELGKIAR